MPSKFREGCRQIIEILGENDTGNDLRVVLEAVQTLRGLQPSGPDDQRLFEDCKRQVDKRLEPYADELAREYALITEEILQLDKEKSLYRDALIHLCLKEDLDVVQLAGGQLIAKRFRNVDYQILVPQSASSWNRG